MARRTKEEALATHHALLDAAEQEFSKHGIAATTLNDIARTAGVTHGALYHHFHDKQALISALIDRSFSPLDSLRSSLCEITAIIPKLRQCCLKLFKLISTDQSARNVQTIAILKCEMMDINDTIHEHYRNMRSEIYLEMKQDIEQAIQNGELSNHIQSHQVAVALFAITHGFIHTWLSDQNFCNLITDGMAAIDAYLAGLLQP